MKYFSGQEGRLTLWWEKTDGAIEMVFDCLETSCLVDFLTLYDPWNERGYTIIKEFTLKKGANRCLWWKKSNQYFWMFLNFNMEEIH